jgi:hypothetical protein
LRRAGGPTGHFGKQRLRQDDGAYPRLAW